MGPERLDDINIISCPTPYALLPTGETVERVSYTVTFSDRKVQYSGSVPYGRGHSIPGSITKVTLGAPYGDGAGNMDDKFALATIRSLPPSVRSLYIEHVHFFEDTFMSAATALSQNTNLITLVLSDELARVLLPQMPPQIKELKVTNCDNLGELVDKIGNLGGLKSFCVDAVWPEDNALAQLIVKLSHVQWLEFCLHGKQHPEFLKACGVLRPFQTLRIDTTCGCAGVVKELYEKTPAAIIVGGNIAKLLYEEISCGRFLVNNCCYDSEQRTLEIRR